MLLALCFFAFWALFVAAQNSTDGNSTEPSITTLEAGRMWISQPQISASARVRIRLGDKLNIAWKYDDNVQVQPANLTLALSTDRRNWRKIETIGGGAKKYTWDTSKWNTTDDGPLLLDTQYVMAIYDERGWDATPMAGYVSPNFDIQFQFYGSSDNECLMCSGAASLQFLPHLLPVLLLAVLVLQ